MHRFPKSVKANIDSSTTTTAREIYTPDWWKPASLFYSRVHPSVLNWENGYWDVWSNCKYELDDKIKEKHENSEASKHLRETKIFPMQSSHTMFCAIATDPIQVTRRGRDRNEVGCLHLSTPPPHSPFSFDSADPVSRHIVRDTKPISALG